MPPSRNRCSMQLVKHVADRSFNCITIDGDTSTNDSFILIASGKSSLPAITSTDSPAYAALARRGDGRRAGTRATDRARRRRRDQIHDDAQWKAARASAECRQIAYAIGHSPLVKTAFYASDPNLGRILAAIGYAGVDGSRRRQDRSVSGRRAGGECRRPESGLPRGRRPARDEEKRDRRFAWCSAAATRRRRSGLAICRTTT